MAAIAVGCSALLILFSVFNGFNAVIDQFYTAFYTDLRIRPAEGKTFHLTPDQWQVLRNQPGVLVAAPVLEDRMLASGTGDAMVATVRGVDERYFKVAQMQPYVRYGQEGVSETRGVATALVGIGIASKLGLSTENVFSQLHLYAPNPEAPVSGLIDPTTAFRSELLQPTGIFAIESDFDEHYILAPLATVQRLLGAGDALSQVDLKLAPGAEPAVAGNLRKAFGNQVRVETRQQQNATFYSIMAAEKWTMYLILVLVLLIASFNLVGALSMLVLEKQKDIAILQAMGAGQASIRGIFLLESLLWSSLGGLIGIVLAIGLCMGQQYFGWIKLQGGFLIDAYPVALQARDVLVVFVTALGLGLVAGWWPSWRAGRQRSGILR